MSNTSNDLNTSNTNSDSNQDLNSTTSDNNQSYEDYVMQKNASKIILKVITIKAPLINRSRLIEGSSSFSMGIIQTINTILGAGIISLPVVIRYLGIVLGILFIIFVGFWTVYTIKLLLDSIIAIVLISSFSI